jgi:hypothetical protein
MEHTHGQGYDQGGMIVVKSIHLYTAHLRERQRQKLWCQFAEVSCKEAKPFDAFSCGSPQLPSFSMSLVITSLA